MQQTVVCGNPLSRKTSCVALWRELRYLNPRKQTRSHKGRDRPLWQMINNHLRSNGGAATYNNNSCIPTRRRFQGLSCPAAAGASLRCVCFIDVIVRLPSVLVLCAVGGLHCLVTVTQDPEDSTVLYMVHYVLVGVCPRYTQAVQPTNSTDGR